MITHTVFFWLRNPGALEDRDALIAGIRKLEAIEGVRSLTVGIPAATGGDVVDASYGVSEILTFDCVEDEAIYQHHPLHLRFVADHERLWSRVMIYDVEHT